MRKKAVSCRKIWMSVGQAPFAMLLRRRFSSAMQWAEEGVKTERVYDVCEGKITGSGYRIAVFEGFGLKALRTTGLRQTMFAACFTVFAFILDKYGLK